MKKCLISIFFTLFFLSCDNPMYTDVVTSEEFQVIQKEKLKGLSIVEAPAKKPVYIQFTKDGAVKVDDASSKNWHISSNDATWRISSNSGTTATNVESGGNGGVKVFKVPFGSIKNINHTEGLVGPASGWEVDEMWDYGDRNLSLNYYFTKNLSSSSQSKLSETYLFHFESSQMMAGQTAYLAGTEWTYLIKDGNGKNYVKIQPIKISTDGSGMTFDNRIYMFTYEMAEEDGIFKGESDTSTGGGT